MSTYNFARKCSLDCSNPNDWIAMLDSPLVWVIRLVLTSLVGGVVLLVLRLSVCLPQFSRLPVLRSKPRLVVVFGSGGHTGEMIRLLRNVEEELFGEVSFITAKVTPPPCTPVDISQVGCHQREKGSISWTPTGESSPVVQYIQKSRGEADLVLDGPLHRSRYRRRPSTG